MPLMIRANRILKDEVIRRKEICLIVNEALNRGYPLRTLKRWVNEALEITRRKKQEVVVEKKYRKIVTTSMDKHIKDILKPQKIQVVNRKTGFIKMNRDPI